MRVLVTVAILATVLGGAARAEKRLFIIANHSGGLSISRCLANGARCGDATAASYCRTHDFAQALSFRKIDRDDITGSVPSGGICKGKACEDYVAIECSR